MAAAAATSSLASFGRFCCFPENSFTHRKGIGFLKQKGVFPLPSGHGRKKQSSLGFALDKDALGRRSGTKVLKLSETHQTDIDLATPIGDESRKKTFLVDDSVLAAVASGLGLTGVAIGSIYGRSILLYKNGDLHDMEMFGIFLVATGFTVGMEYWARWVHKSLWHGCLWKVHMSHHTPRKSFFELNDIFVITNALPALIMLTYGLYNEGLLPALAYGAVCT
eukprot:TRINITY_DN1188_c0_g2_i1.p1 TRINITY_DN1188_c0_g2~~TRINITY_DN1188_c0_g2_i1.p1  ORF type:complete len:222 (-),score=16.61 TRINITY_DN1188_c0_g2_i1:639-1304(-)